MEDEQTDCDIDDNSNGDNGSDNCQESDAESHVQVIFKNKVMLNHCFFFSVLLFCSEYLRSVSVLILKSQKSFYYSIWGR